MKTTIIAGIVLVVIGALALAYQGVSYTTREKAADFGPVEIVTEERHSIPLPPVLGGLALAGGIALLIAGPKRRP